MKLYEVGDTVIRLCNNGSNIADGIKGDKGTICSFDGDNDLFVIMHKNGKKHLWFSSSVELFKPPINEIISLDYRVEYHKKVEECELLQAKYDYLWHTILKEK